eukprot:g10417.t1
MASFAGEESESAKAGVLTIRDARRFGVHLQQVVSGKKQLKQKKGAAVAKPKGKARIRIGDAKLVHRKRAATVNRGRLTWLSCSVEGDAMDFLSTALEELRSRAPPAGANIFPFREDDCTRGYEAYAKVIRRCRKTFRPLGPSSCRPQDIRTHSARRSFCTHLHKEMVPLKAIAAHSGHRKIEQLKEYIELGAEYVSTAHRRLKF